MFNKVNIETEITITFPTDKEAISFLKQLNCVLKVLPNLPIAQLNSKRPNSEGVTYTLFKLNKTQKLDIDYHDSQSKLFELIAYEMLGAVLSDDELLYLENSISDDDINAIQEYISCLEIGDTILKVFHLCSLMDILIVNNIEYHNFIAIPYHTVTLGTFTEDSVKNFTKQEELTDRIVMHGNNTMN